MQNVGSALAVLLGGNYVNRFNLEGRSYQGDPAGAARPAAFAESSAAITTTNTGQQLVDGFDRAPRPIRIR
ncbi:hypothetical protein ACTGJ9_039500 [Bradyrhizobium sp. RDM12]